MSLFRARLRRGDERLSTHQNALTQSQSPLLPKHKSTKKENKDETHQSRGPICLSALLLSCGGALSFKGTFEGAFTMVNDLGVEPAIRARAKRDLSGQLNSHAFRTDLPLDKLPRSVLSARICSIARKPRYYWAFCPFSMSPI